MSINIYALTDSHQESRNLSTLLSGIYNFEKDLTNPFLVLDCGDLFKGIYDKDLSVNAYIELKKLLPQSEIVLTLGNNDFGFYQPDFEYLKETIKKFCQAGINFVCGNLFDQKTNEPSNLVPRYRIINFPNDKRILVTGFCVNTACANKFGYKLIPPIDCIESVIKSVKEPYDKIIVLNHHWYPYSKELKEFAKSKNINIDLIIGGHEHSPIKPDFENKIFYPFSFARSLYKMTLGEDFENIKEISVDKFEMISEFEKPIIEYENKTYLKEKIADRVLDLVKCYSDFCPLGTFISDNMKRLGQTDIAFHSTGYTMAPLKIEDSKIITNYDIKRVICAETTIEKIEITVEQLKRVFENATKNRMLRNQGNSRFIQCSQNVTVTGRGNEKDDTYKILQIEINGEKLLDDNSNPIDPQRKFTATIDPYIGRGEQGFEVLKNLPKTKVLINGAEVKINDLFSQSLIDVSKNPPKNSQYPSAKIIDL